jgi:hypothetical protein
MGISVDRAGKNWIEDGLMVGSDAVVEAQAM